jgi:ABC-type thiamin/hydroxymethylpyrimidine transport system permease subunit
LTGALLFGFGSRLTGAQLAWRPAALLSSLQLSLSAFSSADFLAAKVMACWRIHWSSSFLLVALHTRLSSSFLFSTTLSRFWIQFYNKLGALSKLETTGQRGWYLLHHFNTHTSTDFYIECEPWNYDKPMYVHMT